VRHVLRYVYPGQGHPFAPDGVGDSSRGEVVGSIVVLQTIW